MILSRYIARRFLWAFLQVFFIFGAIMLLIDMVEQLRRFSDTGLGTAGALHLAAMNQARLCSLTKVIMQTPARWR